MASMYDIVRPSLNFNFRKSLVLPPRITFTRSGTADYKDEVGATITAPANTPRLGKHNSNANLPQGLVMGTGEVASLSDASWLSTTAGTVLWVGALSSIATSSILWGITDGIANSNYIRMRIDSATAGRLRLMASVATSVQFTADVMNPIAVDTRYMIATSWSGTTFRVVINDQLQGTHTSAAGIPASLANVALGSPITGISGSVMDGVIERFTYWPFAMGLTQLRALTVAD